MTNPCLDTTTRWRFHPFQPYAHHTQTDTHTTHTHNFSHTQFLTHTEINQTRDSKKHI
jgi:hypothetical protein